MRGVLKFQVGSLKLKLPGEFQLCSYWSSVKLMVHEGFSKTGHDTKLVCDIKYRAQ
jgi:hypothetical protein